MKKIRLLFFGIIILASFLRFYRLDSVPPSLYWDEVSQGYNAYSIAQTGLDEHHEFLPIARFIAFGDYKAPVYIYLDVPFIALLGKTELAVRFPSALLGTLTVIVSYFLAKELFFHKKRKESLGLLTALFLAISPWHVQLSRAAYEANVATFFTALGICLFFYAKRKNPWFFSCSLISLVLGFYAFNAHRIFIPLLIMFLGILYWKSLIRTIKPVLLASCVAGIMLLPFFLYSLTPESKLRFNEVNIFTDLNVIKDSNRMIAEDNNSTVGKIVHNRRLMYGMLYMKHYFDFFNPNYLFFTGDGNPRFSLQDNGELFLWELPLILFGIYALVKDKKRESVFLFGWFILAPIAAATARETPHALRSETYLPTYELFAASGMMCIHSLLETRRRIFSQIFGISVSGIIVVALLFFLHDYFVHFPVTFSGEWQYGYKQAVKITESLKNKYDYVLFTNKYGRPYVYVLFYGNTTPEEYWKTGQVTRDSFGFYTVNGVGKYQFTVDTQNKKYKGKKILLVGDPSEIPSNFNKISKVNFLNGETAFIIADN